MAMENVTRHVVALSIILLLAIVVAYLTLTMPVKPKEQVEVSFEPNENINQLVTNSYSLWQQNEPQQPGFTTQFPNLNPNFGSFGPNGPDYYYGSTLEMSSTSLQANQELLSKCKENHGWVGDGICDDETNTEECLFDNGDCCEDNIKDRFCDLCICHETGLRHDPTPTTTIYDPFDTEPPECMEHRVPLIGDGVCDDFNNNYLCEWDGEDCCKEDANFDTCLVCECMEVFDHLACQITWIADSYCDDENNKEVCNYDGGDCCLADVKTDFCNNCECLDPDAQKEPKNVQ